jgi:hypothetical protein
MARREGGAGRVVRFFQEAPMGEAELLLTLVQDLMRRRRGGGQRARAKSAPKPASGVKQVTE